MSTPPPIDSPFGPFVAGSNTFATSDEPLHRDVSTTFTPTDRKDDA